MSEKPRFTVIEGGKDKPREEKFKEAPFNGTLLRELFGDITKNLPPEYPSNVDFERAASLRQSTQEKLSEQLYGYLVSRNIWEDPTQTYIVLNEVRSRLVRNDFDPR